MTDQMQISIIKNKHDKATGAEKAILASLLNELSYRYPKERIVPGSLCPCCKEYVDSKVNFCPNCGQCLE